MAVQKTFVYFLLSIAIFQFFVECSFISDAYYSNEKSYIDEISLLSLDDLNYEDYVFVFIGGTRSHLSGDTTVVLDSFRCFYPGYFPTGNTFSSVVYRYLSDLKISYVTDSYGRSFYIAYFNGTVQAIGFPVPVEAFSRGFDVPYTTYEIFGSTSLLEETKKQTGIMEEQKEIMEEQKETSKGIFGAIKDFFGSFFDNLINMIKSLIIPSSEELLGFLQEVNDWFGDRLGFIWYPFSLMLELVTALSAGNGSQYLTVPALSLNILGESYTIWNEIQVDMDAFGIFQYVRYFTSALLVAGIVKLASNKWSEWIGGRNSA